MEANGAHELFTLGKMECPAKHKNQRWMDSWKLLESEQMHCSWETWSSKSSDWYCGCDGFDGSCGCDGFDAFVGWVASMLSLDGWHREESIVLIRIWVLRASKTKKEAQKKTN